MGASAFSIALSEIFSLTLTAPIGIVPL
ncbi:hypothetical protein OG2516_09859, partial [Oceanicola granulosus HTCC2516]